MAKRVQRALSKLTKRSVTEDDARRCQGKRSLRPRFRGANADRRGRVVAAPARNRKPAPLGPQAAAMFGREIRRSLRSTSTNRGMAFSVRPVAAKQCFVPPPPPSTSRQSVPGASDISETASPESHQAHMILGQQHTLRRLGDFGLVRGDPSAARSAVKPGMAGMPVRSSRSGTRRFSSAHSANDTPVVPQNRGSGQFCPERRAASRRAYGPQVRCPTAPRSPSEPGREWQRRPPRLPRPNLKDSARSTKDEGAKR